MTWRTVLRETAARLQAAGVEDAAFDARCLLEDIGGMPRGIAADDRPIPAEKAVALEQAITERVSGRPLQYILGEWDFLNLRLFVGEGVLVPRQDTELLCETAAELLQRMKKKVRVLDLCAGSGCVGLGIASLCPGTQVVAVEKSPEAFVFLEKNIARYPDLAVTAVRGDILTDYADVEGDFDGIVSNPPYIPAGDIPHLMREVQREPAMALDGGEDGLKFYRAIVENWAPKLLPGGFLAVEIGFDQGEKVNTLFECAGLKNCRVLRDLAGNDRVVLGFRQ